MRVIDVGGRYFTPATTTSARQDGWMMVQCADAGVLRFANKALDEETAQQLIVQILRSGKRGHLLAGALVESDVPWTPESAEHNAEYFESVTDPHAKAALWDALLPTLTSFFLSGAGSSTPSPSASTDPRPSRPTRRKRARSSTPPEAQVPVASGVESPAR